MTKVNKINYQQKEIFLLNFSNLKEVKEIKVLIDESGKHIRTQPYGSVLTLTNISGMHFSPEIKDLFQDFMKGNRPFVKAGAVIGLNGLQQIVYNGLMKITGRDIKSFENEESAKEWLTAK
jgi:hypothetical protein